MLCLCLIEEIIDEEEFVLLYEAYRHSNLSFPHSVYEFRYSAFVQCACYFFPHAASLCGPFLSCVGICIDDLSA